MLFYTVHPSPRLDYMLDLVSNEIFTEPFIQTSDRSVYLSYTGPKLNYSPERISETNFIYFRINCFLRRISETANQPV